MNTFSKFAIINPEFIFGGELTNTVRWGEGTSLNRDLYDSETGQTYIIHED